MQIPCGPFKKISGICFRAKSDGIELLVPYFLLSDSARCGVDDDQAERCKPSLTVSMLPTGSEKALGKALARWEFYREFG